MKHCLLIIYNFSCVIYGTDMVRFENGIGNIIEENASIIFLILLPVAVVKAVKLCSNRIFQFLTDGGS